MAQALPIVDVSALVADDPDGVAGVAAAMAVACVDTGFFYVAGHDVSSSLIADVFAQSGRLFDQPLDAKMSLAAHLSPASHGYEPIGAQQLDEADSVDQKESFLIGVERAEDDPLVIAGTPNHGPNQWPVGWDDFHRTMSTYFAAMTDLTAQVARGLALSLNLPDDYFVPFNDNPMNMLRLLRYPAAEATSHEMVGAGAHTDWGCVTILAQHDAAGLEVRNRAGEWIVAKPISETFVVNIGDMMARWTNDRYRSTEHRVVNRTGKTRHSAAFFNDINYHAVVECLPGCRDDNSPPRYPPILAGEHIAEMYRKTYG